MSFCAQGGAFRVQSARLGRETTCSRTYTKVVAQVAPGPKYLSSRSSFCGVSSKHLLASLTASRGALVCARGRNAVQVTCIKNSEKTWESQHDKTPYEIMGLKYGCSDEAVKAAYRKLVKAYHPDVAKDMEKDEAEDRFIQLQAAYELLSDTERRQEYDRQHREHPLSANKAFQAYVATRKKAYDQRGDLAVVAWAEQSRYERNVKLKYYEQKGEDEVKRQAHRQTVASQQKYNDITNKHMLVLKRREIERQKAEEAKQQELFQQLLAAEGFELEDEPENGSPKLLE